PALVVTDSQAFGPVSRVVPAEVPLTSFSILMLRYKADLVSAVAGAAALDRLRDGDRVLVSEGCAHHRQCEDIGTVKMPAWLAAHTGAELKLSFTSGADFPEDLTPFSAIVHCGGCTLTAREMRRRQAQAAAQGVPMTNYGVAIAHMHGVLRRSLAPFPEALAALGT
ncbi:TPA: [FeFe] hydrogenase H-cluster maturation GTPase HydF, partial [Clostridioides difficile]|nr:[FeFe] hydrogenase H-cluster maturation GTPase HydF [Clostridioides difficile]